MLTGTHPATWRCQDCQNLVTPTQTTYLSQLCDQQNKQKSLIKGYRNAKQAPKIPVSIVCMSDWRTGPLEKTVCGCYVM